MGFFDKVKHFAGGHGSKVAITWVDKNKPADAKFPLRDSLFQLSAEVTTEQPVTIVGHTFQLWAEPTDVDNAIPKLIAEGTGMVLEGHAYKDFKPYELAAGEQREATCAFERFDLPAILADKLDIQDADSVITSPKVRFYAKFSADVKGSPMDPEDNVDFRIV